MNDTLCAKFANIFREKSAGISNSSTGQITSSPWLSETSVFLLKRGSRFFYPVIPNTCSCDWKEKLRVKTHFTVSLMLAEKQTAFCYKEKNIAFTEISNRDHMEKSIAIKLNVSYYFKITPRNLITLKKILSPSSCSMKN